MASNVLKAIRGAYDVEDKVLHDLGLRDYTVSLRYVTYTGADENKGIKGTAVVKDIPVVPLPKVNMVTLQNVKRAGGYLEEGDFYFYLSATTVTEDMIEGCEGIVYDGRLWKVIKIDGIPDDSMIFQWRVTGRKVEGLELKDEVSSSHN